VAETQAGLTVFGFQVKVSNSCGQETRAIVGDIFGDNSSVHNCHGLGLGQRQCITDGYRTEGDLKMGNEQTIFNLNKSKGE